MGRIPTSNIKNRKKVSIYPSHHICAAIQHQHIDLQARLERYIDKTIHLDALLTVGMRHLDEVMQEIEQITNSVPLVSGSTVNNNHR